MTPTEASDEKNHLTVFLRMNAQLPGAKKLQKPKFHVGDEVRISKVKRTFEKGATPHFSHKIFKVTEVLKTSPVTYKLSDFKDEPIIGSFYEQQLLKTKVPDYFIVDEILGSRAVGPKKEYLVSFEGWPTSFNQYIPQVVLDTMPKKTI